MLETTKSNKDGVRPLQMTNHSLHTVGKRSVVLPDPSLLLVLLSYFQAICHRFAAKRAFWQIGCGTSHKLPIGNFGTSPLDSV
jgi:hypothetical protein